MGGGTLITLVGTGLSMRTQVNICGMPCIDFDEEKLLIAGIIICETPIFDENIMTSPCTIDVTLMTRGNKRQRGTLL